MKEVVNVSISGIAFTLDKECYAMLTDYLTRTERERGAEVTAEVEATIAEQILSQQAAEKPVSTDLLREILERIGGVDLSASGTTSSGDAPRVKIAKRLYRNGQGALLGGVCTGIATYLNLHVALIRILFLIPFIASFTLNIWHFPFSWPYFSGGFSGTAFMLYIILWIVIPKARTARQILEMEGEGFTMDSYERVTPRAAASSACNNSTTVIGSIIRIFALIFSIIILLGSLGTIIAMIFTSQVAYADASNNFQEFLSILGVSLGFFQIVASAVIVMPALAIFSVVIASSRKCRCGCLGGIIFGLWILLLIGISVFIALHATELAHLSGTHITIDRSNWW